MSDSVPIAAIATGVGVSAVGIVRVSGTSLGRFISGLIGHALPARRAVLARFLEANGQTIDQGIALYFPAPHSYTGEDVLELHGHGGPVVLRRLLERCWELGARLAQPGEFTQRAYLNDKLDLAQAEAVADLISAATLEAARGAVRSMQGEFSRRVKELSDELVRLRTFLEATLDFPEDELETQPDAVASRVADVASALHKLISDSRQGAWLRAGIRVVLAGLPNVGKSSVLNALAREELAIVTDIPGTTRDPVRQTLDLDGVPVHFIDTAGLRATDDPVERLGVERTWRAIEQADVVLLLLDASTGPQSASSVIEQLPTALPRLVVANKIDLLTDAERAALSAHEGLILVSAKRGWGLETLRGRILAIAGWQGTGEGMFTARERHIQALGQALLHLENGNAQAPSLELLAEEMRLAHRALGEITGEFTADDLLGSIFSQFCIGK